MAEPAGILIEAQITEKRLASFFKQQISHGTRKTCAGHVLSELLDQGDRYGDILIVNHDPESGTLFLAWVLNRYSPEAATPIWPVLDALAHEMEPTALGRGAVTSILPECVRSLRIRNGRLTRGPARLLPRRELERLSDRLWSFASKDEFPDAARSMRSRDYQCKAFKAAWKDYRKWHDERERPARIAAATEESPYRLVNHVFCWNGRVVERDDYSGRDLAFPGADPETFRMEAGFYADKNHVWQRRLANGSPPPRIEVGGGSINNRAAIWEYHIVAGAVGDDFTWIGDRWDTIFWTDKRRIYAHDKKLGLIPLPDVDASEFRLHGQCFGTDGNSVFYNSRKLPLKVESLQTEGFFIWDDDRVFMTDVEVPLSGKSFRILAHKNPPGSIGQQSRLADADKTIIFGPGNTFLPDDPSF